MPSTGPVKPHWMDQGDFDAFVANMLNTALALARLQPPDDDGPVPPEFADRPWEADRQVLSPGDDPQAVQEVVRLMQSHIADCRQALDEAEQGLAEQRSILAKYL